FLPGPAVPGGTAGGRLVPPHAVRRPYMHRIRSLLTLPRKPGCREAPVGPDVPPPDSPHWRDNAHGSTLFPAARRANSASPAARIASTGAGRPVIRVSWAAAWCSSMGNPPITVDPAAAAAAPSTVGHGA